MKTLLDAFKKNFCKSESRTSSDVLVADKMVELTSVDFMGIPAEVITFKIDTITQFTNNEEGVIEYYLYLDGKLSHLYLQSNDKSGNVVSNGFVFMDTSSQGMNTAKLLAKTSSPKLEAKVVEAQISCEFVRVLDQHESLNVYEAENDHFISEYEKSEQEQEKE